MHPAFDKQIEPEHEIVVYENKQARPLKSHGFPHMSNEGATMEEAVKFIASGEIVVTSSYHGMYWAALLKRRILVVPFGSKFYERSKMPMVKEWTPQRAIDKSTSMTYGRDRLREARDMNEAMQDAFDYVV
jgi:exopolysaccharide biosynthesis predicted pyruvyltransferase EpsI